MSRTVLIVFITTPDRKTSEQLSLGLLKGRWAACVNRIPGLASRYWWKGKIETAQEEMLIVKTMPSKWPGLEKWVRAHHPYSVCEILALPTQKVSTAYSKWVRESLSRVRS